MIKSPVLLRTNKNYMSTAIVFLSLIMILLISQIISPGYLQVSNLSNVLRQAAFLGIVAAGQTLVILTAGTDLSVSFLVTFGNVVSAQIMAGKNENILLSLLAVIAIGTITGLINGIGVHYLRIPSLIMTLGVGSVLQGLAYLYTKGAPKGNAAPFIKWIVSGKLAGVWSPVIILWLITSVLMVFLLKKTTFGRHVYSVGENATAAAYSGVPVARTTLIVYILSGIFACITGMILVGYTGTSYLDAGTDYQMNSIAAVVIGGTLLTGGKGGYVGTIGGTLIICVLLSILNIVQIPTYGREIVRGTVLIIILILFGLQQKENKKR